MESNLLDNTIFSPSFFYLDCAHQMVRKLTKYSLSKEIIKLFEIAHSRFHRIKLAL